MILIELIGVGGLVFVCMQAWREWVGHTPPRESVHIAGEDDQDVDFEAALRSIGRVP